MIFCYFPRTKPVFPRPKILVLSIVLKIKTVYLTVFLSTCNEPRTSALDMPK